MNCPKCSGVMERGYISGKSILRVIPEEGTPKTAYHHKLEDLRQSYHRTDLVGWPLDVPYVGLAPHMPANYCLKCRKVICELDILEYREETL